MTVVPPEIKPPEPFVEPCIEPGYGIRALDAAARGCTTSAREGSGNLDSVLSGRLPS